MTDILKKSFPIPNTISPRKIDIMGEWKSQTRNAEAICEEFALRRLQSSLAHIVGLKKIRQGNQCSNLVPDEIQSQAWTKLSP